MIRFLFNTLHFSRKERIGAFLLTALCAAVFAFPDVAGWFYPQKNSDFSRFQSDIQSYRTALESAELPPGDLFAFDPNTATFDDFVRLGLSEKVAGIIGRYRDKGGRFRTPEDFQKIWSLQKEDYERLLPYIRIETEKGKPANPVAVSRAYELFSFNPNTATEQDLLRLGLPPGTVRSILNYRSKGGRFKAREDVGKIYTLDETDFERLKPYMLFDGLQQQKAALPVAYSETTEKADRRSTVIQTPLDINLAGEEEWQRLPGIGEKRSQQIIKYRTSLGGFLSTDQVAEMYGLPDSVFQRIRPLLKMEHADVRKIDINSATPELLDVHPYISIKQAKLIVSYRDQHGPYASVDDLARIAAFSDRKWLEKVKPYLTAN